MFNQREIELLLSNIPDSIVTKTSEKWKQITCIHCDRTSKLDLDSSITDVRHQPGCPSEEYEQLKTKLQNLIVAPLNP